MPVLACAPHITKWVAWGHGHGSPIAECSAIRALPGAASHPAATMGKDTAWDTVRARARGFRGYGPRPGSAQPSPAQPGPTRPSPAQPGPAQPDPAQLLGRHWFGGSFQPIYLPE